MRCFLLSRVHHVGGTLKSRESYDVGVRGVFTCPHVFKPVMVYELKGTIKNVSPIKN